MKQYTVKISKSMILYCFAACNADDFDRRIFILSKYIKSKLDKQYDLDVLLAIANIFSRGENK